MDITCLKLIAMMFLVRSYYYAERKDFERSGSYKTAYHLLCYALHEREDCISNFDFYAPASQFILEHPRMDVWDYEDAFENFLKEWLDKNGKLW